MIKANELRIGNWVAVKLDPPFSFGSVVSREGWAPVTEIGNTDREDFYPIPLTPEILEKAGFEFSGIDTHILNFEDDWYLEIEDMGEEYTIWLYEDDKDKKLPIAVNYKHIHQLQNLYFALTGEELEINL